MANTRMPRGAIPTPRNKLAAATPYTIKGTTPPDDRSNPEPSVLGQSRVKIKGSVASSRRQNIRERQGGKRE
jgi:hypothetical protein